MRATADAPAPTASNPATTAKFTIHRTGQMAAGRMRTSCFSPAVTTMARRAGANGTPWSPTAGGLAGLMATAHLKSTTLTTPTNFSAAILTRLKVMEIEYETVRPQASRQATPPGGTLGVCRHIGMSPPSTTVPPATTAAGWAGCTTRSQIAPPIWPWLLSPLPTRYSTLDVGPVI